jgi:hypothetical protein
MECDLATIRSIISLSSGSVTNSTMANGTTEIFLRVAMLCDEGQNPHQRLAASSGKGGGMTDQY